MTAIYKFGTCLEYKVEGARVYCWAATVGLLSAGEWSASYHTHKTFFEEVEKGVMRLSHLE